MSQDISQGAWVHIWQNKFQWKVSQIADKKFSLTTVLGGFSIQENPNFLQLRVEEP